MDIRSLQVTAPLGPNDGAITVLKRLGKVLAFYACAAVLGAAAVALFAVLARLLDYFQTANWLLMLEVTWCVLTVGLIALFIYRRTLTVQIEDQIFLKDEIIEDQIFLEDEILVKQRLSTSKLDRLASVLRYLSLASGTLTLALVVLYVLAISGKVY
jgi:hypothetical protein